MDHAFQVVGRESFRSEKIPKLMVFPDGLLFNMRTVGVLNIQFIQMQMCTEDGSIRIKPCEKNSPDSIQWVRIKNGKRIPKKIMLSSEGKERFRSAGWQMDGKHKVCGLSKDVFDEGNKMRVVLFKPHKYGSMTMDLR